MTEFDSNIEQHYYKPGLYHEILEKLKEKGVDTSKVTTKDLKTVDEFHIRGAAVSRELASSINIDQAKVLDVGCGIGGPCRMLTNEYNCLVTGIDISQEYIDTAKLLTQLVGSKYPIEFLRADATQLPFGNESFDVVWTQHVQMNIEDKNAFYSEIARVLSPKGYFLYYDIYRNGEGALRFPLPWAEKNNISFLFEVKEIENLLKPLGLTKIHTQDQTSEGIQFFKNLLENIQKNGLPILGLHVLMGGNFLEKINNLLEALQSGKLMLQSGVYLK